MALNPSTEKSQFGFANFLAVQRNTRLPRTERFEVSFNTPRSLGGLSGLSSGMSIMCEEAQIPGFVTNTVPIKIGPWTEYRTQNLDFLTSDVVFTFIIDETWGIRTLFERWIQHCVDPKSKEVKFHDDMYSDLEIKSLSDNDIVLAKWKVYEAIPKLISLTPLAWGNIGFMRMSVAMSAKYWERKI
jgi:hypothetical protein